MKHAHWLTRAQDTALRIGVVYRGKILEERIVRPQSVVSIGHTPRQTLCLPFEDIPQHQVLFRLQGGRFVLQPAPNIRGRIQTYTGVHQARKLLEAGPCPLERSTRGFLRFGDVSLLFQVIEPPKRKTSRLPTFMRYGTSRPNFLGMALFVFSALLQTSSVAWVMHQDWPEPQDVRGLPDHFVEALAAPVTPKAQEEEPPEPEETETAASKPEKKPQKTAQNVRKKRAKSSPKDPQPSLAQARKKSFQRIEKETILGRLGHLADNGQPAIFNQLIGKSPTHDLDTAFRDAGSISTVRRAASRLVRPGGSKTGTVETIERLRGPKTETAVNIGKKKDAAKVTSRIRIRDTKPVVDQPGFVPSGTIANVFRRRKQAVQRCYERSVKRIPSLAGKVTLRFTISPAGRISQANVVRNTMATGEVGLCIVQNLKRWRFPKPKGGSVVVKKSFVFSVQD